MGVPSAPLQSPSPPRLYPHALQLKLYQAFIFSIPILFSIILILLLYLFYLKRRAYNLTAANQRMLPTTTFNSASIPFLPSIQSCQMGFKGDLRDVLPTVSFDEDLKEKNSQCCVCLGDYELKEEVIQVPSCKHVFHVDCIRHWLQSNSTCPLCRCLVVAEAASPDTKLVVLSEPLSTIIHSS